MVRSHQRKVILLVDDEPQMLSLISAILSPRWFEVLLANDGFNALEISHRQRGHIDLLLSDVEMPGLTGVELARSLLAERAGTRILLMSGKPGTSPDFPFLPKPFTRNALTSKIREVLEGPPQTLA